MFPRNHLSVLLCAAGLQFFVATAAHAADPADTQHTPSKKNQAIPWDQLGAKAGADYHGEGLAVAATEAGARFHCAFQCLDGDATGKGLWLDSTVTNQPADRFRVVVTAVGRQALTPQGTVTVTGRTVRFARAGLVEEYSVSLDGLRQDFVVLEKPAGDGELKVQLAVSGARMGPATYGAQLVLEKSGRKIAYSRLHATDANGKELPARIEVIGRDGFHSVPDMNGDAVERVPTNAGLAIWVNDAGAVYPVRIDPTFSDANWVSMNPGIPGTDGTVYAAVTDGSGNLYIGGQFTFAGTVAANNIARWNGSTWSALGSGMNGYVNALAAAGGTLYAGGSFTTAGGNAANFIAQWNGSSWSALGSGMGGGSFPYVYGLAVSGSTLYACGGFTTAGGNAANYVAQLNGTTWSRLGSGMNGAVAALAVSAGTLYAGGGFTMAGANGTNHIAQWNGSSWSPLGSGMNGNVGALAVSGGTLYAGGSSIAQWDGSSWSALGSGINGAVWALAVSGGTLYAGGFFTNAGGNAANYIAQWNGSSWSALGSGMNSPVSALAVSGGTLYAGGGFGIAQWDGSSWSALGSGMNGAVSALAVSGGTLYAGGSFTTAGGNPANYIAQWNGSSWNALGSGMNYYVNALAVFGGTLYAGGQFTTAGGNPANYIARWDGSSWSALGSGMNSTVSALAVSGGTLYAGGQFTTAGGKVSPYAAEALFAGPPPFIITTNTSFGFTNGHSAFGFDVSGSLGQTQVVLGSTNLTIWVPLQTNALNGSLWYFSDPSASNFTQRFYRAELQQ